MKSPQRLKANSRNLPNVNSPTKNSLPANSSQRNAAVQRQQIVSRNRNNVRLHGNKFPTKQAVTNHVNRSNIAIPVNKQSNISPTQRKQINNSGPSGTKSINSASLQHSRHFQPSILVGSQIANDRKSNLQRSTKNYSVVSKTSFQSSPPLAAKNQKLSLTSNAQNKFNSNLSFNEKYQSLQNKNNLPSSVLSSLEKNGISVSSLQKSGIIVTNADDDNTSLVQAKEIPNSSHSKVNTTAQHSLKKNVDIKHVANDKILPNVQKNFVGSNSLTPAYINVGKRKILHPGSGPPNKLLCLNKPSMPSQNVSHNSKNTLSSRVAHAEKIVEKTQNLVNLNKQVPNLRPRNPQPQPVSYSVKEKGKNIPSDISAIQICSKSVSKSANLPSVIPKATAASMSNSVSASKVSRVSSASAPSVSSKSMISKNAVTPSVSIITSKTMVPKSVSISVTSKGPTTPAISKASSLITSAKGVPVPMASKALPQITLSKGAPILVPSKVSPTFTTAKGASSITASKGASLTKVASAPKTSSMPITSKVASVTSTPMTLKAASIPWTSGTVSEPAASKPASTSLTSKGALTIIPVEISKNKYLKENMVKCASQCSKLQNSVSTPQAVVKNKSDTIYSKAKPQTPFINSALSVTVVNPTINTGLFKNTKKPTVVNLTEKPELIEISDKPTVVNLDDKAELIKSVKKPTVNPSEKVQSIKITDPAEKAELIKIDGKHTVVNLDKKSELMKIIKPTEKAELIKIEVKPKVVNLDKKSELIKIMKPPEKIVLIKVDDGHTVNTDKKSESNKIYEKTGLSVVEVEKQSESEVAKKPCLPSASESSVPTHKNIDLNDRKALLSLLSQGESSNPELPIVDEGKLKNNSKIQIIEIQPEKGSSTPAQIDNSDTYSNYSMKSGILSKNAEKYEILSEDSIKAKILSDGFIKLVDVPSLISKWPNPVVQLKKINIPDKDTKKEHPSHKPVTNNFELYRVKNQLTNWKVKDTNEPSEKLACVDSTKEFQDKDLVSKRTSNLVVVLEKISPKNAAAKQFVDSENINGDSASLPFSNNSSESFTANSYTTDASPLSNIDSPLHITKKDIFEIKNKSDRMSENVDEDMNYMRIVLKAAEYQSASVSGNSSSDTNGGSFESKNTDSSYDNRISSTDPVTNLVNDMLLLVEKSFNSEDFEVRNLVNDIKPCAVLIETNSIIAPRLQSIQNLSQQNTVPSNNSFSEIEKSDVLVSMTSLNFSNSTYPSVNEAHIQDCLSEILNKVEALGVEVQSAVDHKKTSVLRAVVCDEESWSQQPTVSAVDDETNTSTAKSPDHFEFSPIEEDTNSSSNIGNLSPVSRITLGKFTFGESQNLKHDDESREKSFLGGIIFGDQETNSNSAMECDTDSADKSADANSQDKQNEGKVEPVPGNSLFDDQDTSTRMDCGDSLYGKATLSMTNSPAECDGDAADKYSFPISEDEKGVTKAHPAQVLLILKCMYLSVL